MRFYEFQKKEISEMAAIGVSGLFKYRGDKKRDRIPIFLNKIKNSSPFTINTREGKVEVIIDPSELERVEDWIKQPSGNLKLKTTSERYPLISFNSIVKTPEFGGEAAFSREKIEQGQIAEIESQLENIKSGQPSVKLKVGNRAVDAASVEKEKASVSGRAPKSDMTVLDANNKPIAWVSLKGNHFRWGGWQHLATLPEIKQWMNRIRKINNGEFKPGMAFGLKISSDLANKIVFGKNFGGSSGISNVDLVLIGDVKIENRELTASRSYANGETPAGADKPYLLMRYVFGRNDLGFKNVRAETNRSGEQRRVHWLNSDADVDSVIKLFREPLDKTQ